jgi:hypothetical protein
MRPVGRRRRVFFGAVALVILTGLAVLVAARLPGLARADEPEPSRSSRVQPVLVSLSRAPDSTPRQSAIPRSVPLPLSVLQPPTGGTAAEVSTPVAADGQGQAGLPVTPQASSPAPREEASPSIAPAPSQPSPLSCSPLKPRLPIRPPTSRRPQRPQPRTQLPSPWPTPSRLPGATRPGTTVSAKPQRNRGTDPEGDGQGDNNGKRTRKKGERQGQQVTCTEVSGPPTPRSAADSEGSQRPSLTRAWTVLVLMEARLSFFVLK